MTTEAGVLGYYNPKALIESSTNPRKGPVDVSDLLESVREHGILEPLLGRLTPGGEVEVVCGARRRACAQELGLSEIPVMVREHMSDADALAAQIVENRDRRDVHPMPEAEAYEALLSMPNEDGTPRTLEDVARKVALPLGYLKKRLALLKLAPDARAAFASGRIGVDVAMLLATLKKADQLKALVDVAAPEDGARGPVPYRVALEHVRRTFLLRLAEAPFQISADDLVPGVGACAKCPKRTGSNPDLFGGFDDAELCSDASCYRKKTDAAWVRLEQAARDSGRSVLTEKESAEVFRFGATTAASDAAYVDLDDPCRDDPKERTFRELLSGKDVPTVLARDGRGGVHDLVDRKSARATVRAALPAKAAEKVEADDKAKEAHSAAEAEDRIRKDTYRIALEIFGEKAVAKGLPLRVVIEALLPKAHDTAKAWKLNEDGAIEKVKGSDLTRLALECALEIVVFPAFMRGENAWIEAVAGSFGVDLNKVRAQAEAPAEPKKSGPIERKKAARSKSKK